VLRNGIPNATPSVRNEKLESTGKMRMPSPCSRRNLKQSDNISITNGSGGRIKIEKYFGAPSLDLRGKNVIGFAIARRDLAGDTPHICLHSTLAPASDFGVALAKKVAP